MSQASYSRAASAKRPACIAVSADESCGAVLAEVCAAPERHTMKVRRRQRERLPADFEAEADIKKAGSRKAVGPPLELVRS